MESPVNVEQLREMTMSTQSVTSRAALLRENVLIESRHVSPQVGSHLGSQVGSHLGSHLGSLGRRLIETLREWRQRTQSRHELAMLSEIERKDLGYPDRIQAELAKPFWRA
jgi:uncharacterized protein YjiS (DUF1127 family)